MYKWSASLAVAQRSAAYHHREAENAAPYDGEAEKKRRRRRKKIKEHRTKRREEWPMRGSITMEAR